MRIANLRSWLDDFGIRDQNRESVGAFRRIPCRASHRSFGLQAVVPTLITVWPA
jgi:hypothetical protein